MHSQWIKFNPFAKAFLDAKEREQENSQAHANSIGFAYNHSQGSAQDQAALMAQAQNAVQWAQYQEAVQAQQQQIAAYRK